MTIDWFSFFFGAMSLLCVEFLVVLGIAVNVYKKQGGQVGKKKS